MKSLLARPDWPLCLYLASVLWGATISYDSAGAIRYAVLIGLGTALHLMLRVVPSHVWCRGGHIPLLRIFFGVTPCVIVAYFVLTNDWSQPVEKVVWLQPVRYWLEKLVPHAAWGGLHPNVVGGVLAMWLPLQIAALRSHRTLKGRRVPAGISGARNGFLVGLSCAGMLLAGLRGAWLAIAVAGAMALWWKCCELGVGRHRAWFRLCVWLGGVGAMLAALIGSPIGEGWLAARPDRLQVWRNSWDLAWDYSFTGLGLGGFSMAYSSYALLVHVPHTTHAHNLALDIWLAQGLTGIAAFTWLAVGSLRPIGLPTPDVGPAHSRHAERWHAAAAMSLLILLVHGFVDDVYYGYAGAGLVVLLVPIALLRRGRRDVGRTERTRSRLVQRAVVGAATTGIAIAAVSDPVRAQWQANVGALKQTCAELMVYRWPAWPVQDALRRADVVDLEPALQRYRASLAIDADNTTANRRIGQIELSRGRYDSARRCLAAAYRTAPAQVATRQLFGESLAITGNVVDAARLWRTLPLGEDQLEIRRSWYESIGEPGRARQIAAAMALAGK